MRTYTSDQDIKNTHPKNEQEKRLLLIDDDEIQLIIMEAFIGQLKAPISYHSSKNGQDAISYLEELTHKAFPEYIFVDINMPVMDGFEFLESYEEKFSKHFPDTRVFMLTSSIREEDRRKARSFGAVDEFFTKPLSKNTFLHIMEKAES